MIEKTSVRKYHWFLDEAGDITFYGNGNQAEFYADMLAHLLHGRINDDFEKLVLNILEHKYSDQLVGVSIFTIMARVC